MPVFIVMRALLIIFASLSGYLIVSEIAGSHLAFIGLASGVLIALIAIGFEERVKRVPLRILMGGSAGLITGLVVANLLTYPLVLNFLNDKDLEAVAYLLANSVIGYVGLSIGMKKGDELDGSFSLFREKEKKDKIHSAPAKKTGLLIDTSVIIDGRIADLCETGFIEGPIIVPKFVLQELQYIADSPDSAKRSRGKRGLDILKQIQENKKTGVEIFDHDFPSIKDVDGKLVVFAQDRGMKILTNDANLNKIAELQGVEVLNINRLATALKPVVLPGEVMNILVQKEGKEHGQGIGYLEDGTMVVIDNAREFLGRNIDVTITSVLQTSGGRMIFSKAKEELRKAAYQ